MSLRLQVAGGLAAPGRDVGCLGALQIGRTPDAVVPRLPKTSLMGDSAGIGRAVLDALSGLPDGGNAYRIPAVNPQPAQETLPARPAVP